jgi:hypothetical protein
MVYEWEWDSLQLLKRLTPCPLSLRRGEEGLINVVLNNEV